MRPDGTAANKAAATSCGAVETAMSIAVHNGETFAAGDNIYICPDAGTYTSQITAPSSGSAGSPIVYTSDPANKAILLELEAVTDGALSWANTGDWTDNADDTWTIGLTNVYIYRLFIDGTEYPEIKSVLNIAAAYPWFQDASKDSLTIYTGGQGAPNNPATLYTSMTGIQGDQYAFLINNKEYITIENLDIRAGYAGSLYIARSNNIVIKNNIIGKYSRYGVFVAGVPGADDESSIIDIDSNTIDSGAVLTWNADSDVHIPSGIFFLDGVHTSTIRNNTIKNWNHAGIDFVWWTAANPGSGYKGNDDNIISNNDISSPTLVTEARGISVEGGASMAVDNIVRYNDIHDLSTQNQINGKGTLIHNNIFRDMVSTAVSGTSCRGLGFSDNGTDRLSEDIKVYNNSFIDIDCQGIAFNNFAQAATVNNIGVVNNIFYNTDTEGSNIAIFIEDDADVLGLTFTNNDIYSDATTTTIDYRGTTSTVAAWSATGTDTQTDNIVSDPLFVNAAGGDFNLKTGSPAIDVGADLGDTYTYDYRGRNQDSFGSGWEVGARIYPSRKIHRKISGQGVY